MDNDILHEITLCTDKIIYFIDRTKPILKKIVKFKKNIFPTNHHKKKFVVWRYDWEISG